MHVLVTGCSSFLGRHVTWHLVRKGLNVTGTYRTESAVTRDLHEGGATLVQMDLADSSALALLPKRVDGIVHVAGASTSAGVSVDDMLRCNVAGAQNIISYARAAGAGRLAYASTLSAYGRITDSTVDETTPIRDADVYGASKYLAERMFATSGDLSGAAVRLPGVLGQGAHRAWVPTLLQSLKANRDVTIYGPANLFNNAAYVDDLSELFLKVLTRKEAGFPAFPVGAAGFTTVGKLVERLVQLTQSRSTIDVSDVARPSFTISSAFAIDRFGYRPKTIDEMIAQYCAEAV